MFEQYVWRYFEGLTDAERGAEVGTMRHLYRATPS